MLDFLMDVFFKPFFKEKLRVVKYISQKATAEQLLQSDTPLLLKKGLSLLFELAISYPYRRQEIINSITAFLRRKFPQDVPVPKGSWEVLELGVRSLSSAPRLDENGFPLNFDIHQVRIEGLDLTRTNFRHFSLWGCQFHNVVLSHSSFEEADLGGTVFSNCSLEYADLTNAKLCGSFMDKGRPTRFVGTRLWGANLKDANVEFCELQKVDEVELSALQRSVDEKKMRIL